MALEQSDERIGARVVREDCRLPWTAPEFGQSCRAGTEQVAIAIGEGLQPLALHIDGAYHPTILDPDRHDHLRAGRAKSGQVADILSHILHDHRSATLDRCSIQPLIARKNRVGRCARAGPSDDSDVSWAYVVKSDPTILSSFGDGSRSSRCLYLARLRTREKTVEFTHERCELWPHDCTRHPGEVGHVLLSKNHIA